MSRRTFYNKTSTTTKSIEYARKLGLLPGNGPHDCIRCKAEGSVGWVKRGGNTSIPYRLRCTGCGSRVSPAVGTWFEEARITMQQSLTLMRLFAERLIFPGQNPYEYCMSEAGVSKETVVNYFNYMREVCQRVVSAESNPIGGEGHVVEIDETHLSARKYHRGQVLKGEREEVWVFGGIDRDTKECFLKRVDRRDRDTLVSTIRECVLPGTRIICDSWKTRPQLEEEGFVRALEECGLNLVDPEEPIVHSRNIEHMWRSVKCHVRRVQGTCEGHEARKLDVFLYTRRFTENRCLDHVFETFARDVAKAFPGYGKESVI